MTVTIKFETPARVQPGPSSAAHERNLENVPLTTAQQMTQDFEAYEENPSEDRRHKLYTYPSENGHSSGGEALVALDFGEVIALDVAGVEHRAAR